MSFDDLNLEDTPDREIMPEGETLLTCKSATVRESKATPGTYYVELMYEPATNPLADLIVDRLFIPREDDDDRKKVNKRRAMKTALEALGVPLEVGNAILNQARTGSVTVDEPIDAMLGQQTWAKLGIETDDKGLYPPKNRVSAYTRRA